MKYYIIAGEASGDLHGSNLVYELKLLDQNAEFRAWGGDKMRNSGATLIRHYRDLAFMGFIEVIKNLRTILHNLKFCKKDILVYQPDVLILIDYPGFNLRIAKWAKAHGLKVIFYISPQVWAWKESRVKNIKASVDKMIVILPFEKQFYEKWDYAVDYVGHPLIEVIENFKKSHPQINNIHRKKIALLPGSRKQELEKKLPIMLAVAKHFPDHEFVVAKAPGLDDDFYADYLLAYKNVSAVRDQTYALLMESSAALVTSGTATLETALFAVPEVVCYKGNPISYRIAKWLITIKYISLVNLIMDREVVKELIQHELNLENILKELKALLFDEKRKSQIKSDYIELKELLSLGGNASANAAKIIWTFLNAASSQKL